MPNTIKNSCPRARVAWRTNATRLQRRALACAERKWRELQEWEHRWEAALEEALFPSFQGDAMSGYFE